MISDKILELDSKKGLAYLFVFSALVAPGMLFFYLFNFSLFLDLDFSKLLLASISLSIPPFLLSLLMIAEELVFFSDSKTEYDTDGLVIFSSVASVLMFFIAVFVWWLFGFAGFNHEAFGFLVYWYLTCIGSFSLVMMVEWIQYKGKKNI